MSQTHGEGTSPPAGPAPRPPAFRAAPGLQGRSAGDRFFLFSLSPAHWRRVLLGVDSVSLAGAGVGERKQRASKGSPSRDEAEARRWVALWLARQPVSIRGPWAFSSWPRPPATGIRGGLRGEGWGFRPPASSRKLPETLVLITVPPSAAKAVDGYVKPQIKQVVPE